MAAAVGDGGRAAGTVFLVIGMLRLGVVCCGDGGVVAVVEARCVNWIGKAAVVNAGVVLGVIRHLIIRSMLQQRYVILLPRHFLRVCIICVLVVLTHIKIIGVIIILRCLIQVIVCCRFLFQRGPPFFTNHRIAILLAFLIVVFENCRSGWRL